MPPNKFLLKPGQFSVLYNNNKPKCLIGTGNFADGIKEILKDSEQHSIEYVLQQSHEWVNERQFLVGISSVKLKQKIVNYLDRYRASYFSLIGHNNNFHSQCNIGRGTFVNYCNEMLGCPQIGDHCIVTAYCQIAHNTVIKDFCHISAYSYINNVTLGTGSVLGLRSSIGNRDNIVTADYCNFIINSVVTKSVTQSGTYFGNRKLSDESTLDNQIL